MLAMTQTAPALVLNPVCDIYEVTRSMFGQYHADRWLNVFGKVRESDASVAWRDVSAAFVVWLGCVEVDREAIGHLYSVELASANARLPGGVMALDASAIVDGDVPLTRRNLIDQIADLFTDHDLARAVEHVALWDDADGCDAVEMALADEGGGLVLTYGDRPGASHLITVRRISGDFFRAVNRRIRADLVATPDVAH